MTTKKATIEYGVLVAPLGGVDNGETMTKATFFQKLEEQYPSSEGWKLFSAEGKPNERAVILIYHMTRVIS